MSTAIIYKYFDGLTENQKSQFAQLAEIYAFWNEKINLISRKDFHNFYLHHVLHSLAIAKFVSFKDFTEIMDAGTGGGFPGIPLAILFPNVSFYLVDSIGKKIKVVDEVVNTLDLGNVNTAHLRMEQVDHTFDFIVSRAVTGLPDFVKWTSYKFHRKSFNSLKNGILYLKGGDLKPELKKLKGFKNRVYDLNSCFLEDYFATKKLVHIYR